MSELFKWLSNNTVASNLLIGLVTFVVVAIISIYFIAFLQGRSISFWPPKIGRISQKLQQKATTTSQNRKNNVVFIIHGRNHTARDAIILFLRVLGLQPLDFDDVVSEVGGSPYILDVVLEGMRRAQGVIALFTPDEFSILENSFRKRNDLEKDIARAQARPNVIFETGLAMSIDRDRVIIVQMGDEIGLFSDIAGIHTVHLTNSSRAKLRDKLISVGCNVDLRTTAWQEISSAGDFDKCIYSQLSEFREFFNKLPAAGAVDMDIHFHDDFQWETLFRNSKNIRIMATWARTFRGSTHAFLREAARRGAAIQIILPDVENELIVSELACRFDKTPGDIRTLIKEATKEFADISGIPSSTSSLWYLKKPMLFFALVFDKTAIIGFYDHGGRRGQIPWLMARKGGWLYQFVMEQLNFVTTKEVGRKVL